LRRRLPRWFYRSMSFIGASMVALVVFFAPGHLAAASLAVIFPFISVDSFFFYSVPVALRHKLFGDALVIALGAAGTIPAAEALTLVVVSSVIAFMVAWLVRAAALAETDQLTGLLNRSGLQRSMQVAMESAVRSGKPLAVALFDLDRFKAVTSRVGEEVGNQLLREVAAAIRAGLPQGAIAARYSGDGFVALFPGLEAEQAAVIADELRSKVSSSTSCSVGVSEMSPGDNDSQLTARVRDALDAAKQQGRNCVAVRVSNRAAIEELAEGIAKGQLRVLYQPIVSLSGGVLLGAEALVRWEHPERGLISPDRFVPLAEESGLIVELGHVVARVATATAASWPAGLKLSVNASGPELDRPEYVTELLEILSTSCFDPNNLVVEVTESRLEQDSGQMLANLAELRRHGARVALDDFGTGYSSLSRLSLLPIDSVKIDRSFVSPIGPETRDAPIIAAVCAMARATGRTVIAEGIEHLHQAEVLFAHGCDEGQGYFYGRPGPESSLLALAKTLASPGRPAEGAKSEGLTASAR
jgi:diguanylate cyclase (GGDEF)-like protein